MDQHISPSAPTVEPPAWNDTAGYLSAAQAEQTMSLLLLLQLPIELVVEILDLAEYWPVAEFSCSLRVTARSGTNGSLLYLRTLPLPGRFHPEDGEGQPELIQNYELRGPYPIRKVVFRLASRDQGWSSNRGQGMWAVHLSSFPLLT